LFRWIQVHEKISICMWYHNYSVALDVKDVGTITPFIIMITPLVTTFFVTLTNCDLNVYVTFYINPYKIVTIGQNIYNLALIKFSTWLILNFNMHY